MDVARPKLVLDSSVLPSATRETFVPRRLDYMKAQAKRPRPQRARVIQFLSIDSDGACALVTAGRGGAFDIDLYEKTGDRWSFVRRVGGLLFD